MIRCYEFNRDDVIQNQFIETVFGRDLFDAILAKHGRDGWNTFAESLSEEIAPLSSPIKIEVDLSGQDFRKADLGGLDLTHTCLALADFSDANLTGASIGFACGASFRGADLRRAAFVSDISGTDFAAANVEETEFSLAVCDHSRLPRNLPNHCMEQLSLLPPSEYYVPDALKKNEQAQPLLLVRATLRSLAHPFASLRCKYWGMTLSVNPENPEPVVSE